MKQSTHVSKNKKDKREKNPLLCAKLEEQKKISFLCAFKFQLENFFFPQDNFQLGRKLVSHMGKKIEKLEKNSKIDQTRLLKKAI